MEYVLQTQELTKRYGDFRALDGLDMHVPKGAIYGLAGRNGAGKTTLIRIIAGLQAPTAGAFQLFGAAHTDNAIRAARRRMGSLIETPAFYPGMSAEANLKVQIQHFGLPSFADIPALLELVGLEHTGRKPAGRFSLGMRQRLGITLALCGNPDLLVLDEPMNGLDPQGIIEMRELLLRLNRDRDMTILISSHILDELARVATHYGFVSHGRMVKEVTAAEMEKSCRKCTRITVSDMQAMVKGLDGLGLEYRILDGETAEIFGSFSSTALIEALSAAGCRVGQMTTHDETLEGYFMQLVGGDAL